MGGPDIVLPCHLEHRGARISRDLGDLVARQRNHRQDPRIGPLPASRREPVQADAEDDDQQDCEHEARGRDADHRDGRGDVVRPAIVAERGEDAERDADADRDDEGHDAELDRNRPALAQDVVHAAVAVLVRRPEIELEHPTEPVDVLLPDGLVQAVDLVEPPDRVELERLLTIPRPAWDRVHQGEGDQGDDEENREQPEDPSDDETEHFISP